MRQFLTALLCLVITCINLNAERKKVAVVLSGGGAKGVAHIGVLKVIERAGIPVDIVTGTSMGSIVGGLYSLGYSADQLDSVVRAQDWNYVITDKEKLHMQSIDDRRKEYTYAISTGRTFRKRNTNDGGLIKGKNLDELFYKLCEGYTDSLDFSHDLPIPFACVATNIIDNSEVDFHSGCLPQAMRASMAIPIAFSPVRMGDMVLVDGGLRNNFPADIAREMGADIIIGVTVQGPPKKAEDLGGMMSIVNQIVDVNCKNKYDDNLAITDVAVRVNTTGYSTASFNDAAIDSLLRRGEEEALRHWDELIALKQHIGIDDSFVPQHHQAVRPGRMPDRRKVTTYEFQNMTKADERFLREKFHLRPGDSIDTRREQELTTSMRIDLFYQTAHLSTVSEDDGVRVVLTAGNRKSSQLSVGLRYDAEEHAALQACAAFPVATAHPIDIETTVRLGKRIMARGEMSFHSHSITRPKISVTYRRNDVDVYIDGDRDYSILYNQCQAELSPLNITIRNFDMTLGARWDYVHYQDKLLSTRSKDIELKRDHYFSYRGVVNFNSEDNWVFPTRGSRFRAEYAYLTDNFVQLNDQAGMSEISAHWRTSISLTKRFALQPTFYGRMLFCDNIPLIFANAAGGAWFGHYVEQQMPFAGMGNIEYLKQHFVAAQLQGQQRIASSHYIKARFAVGQQSDDIEHLFKNKPIFGCQLVYAYSTMFGPVGAAVGYCTKTKEPNFYINLGFEF